MPLARASKNLVPIQDLQAQPEITEKSLSQIATLAMPCSSSGQMSSRAAKNLCAILARVPDRNTNYGEVATQKYT